MAVVDAMSSFECTCNSWDSVVEKVTEIINATTDNYDFGGTITSISSNISVGQFTKSMSGLFTGMGSEATNLGYTLVLTNLKTDGVTDISKLFYNSSAGTLYLDNFDFTNVTSYDDMFYGCSLLTTVYVKNQASKDFIDARLSEAGLSITSTIVT